MTEENAKPSPQQSCLTSNTLEQVLCVIYLVHLRYEKRQRNISIPDTRQEAVHRVAELFNVSYQTINDACFRRIGMHSIKQFDELLYDWLVNRDHSKLVQTLKSYVQPMEQNLVDQVILEDNFEVLENAVALREQKIAEKQEQHRRNRELEREERLHEKRNRQRREPRERIHQPHQGSRSNNDDMKTFMFHLERKKGEQLLLLAGLQNVEVAEYIKSIIEKTLTDEMLNVMKQQIQNMEPEKRKVFLDSL